MDNVTIRERLPKLARTMTQSEAARVLKISRQRVQQIADEEDISFVKREFDGPTACPTCGRETLTDTCLRCKWTPEAVRGLRMRLRLTQDEFSFLLKVGTATVTRWEGGQPPGLTGVEKLEEQERRLLKDGSSSSD